jgi:DNA-binding transcriptional ArsR family regulator
MGSILPLRSPVEDGQHRGPRLVGIDDEAADEVFAALSSATARAILGALYEQPGTASDLARAADTSLQNVRYHLDKLEAAGLIEVVDTWYSERGTEMSVYAPADDSLVVFAGEEEDHSLRAALSSLLGGVGLLAVVALVLDRLARTLSLESLFDADPSADPPGTETPPAGTTGAPSGIAEPTVGATPLPTTATPGKRAPTTAVDDSAATDVPTATDAPTVAGEVTASPAGPTPTAPGRSTAGSTAEAARIERATPTPDGATARATAAPDRDAGATTPTSGDPTVQPSTAPDATVATDSVPTVEADGGDATMGNEGSATETVQSREPTAERATAVADPTESRRGSPAGGGDRDGASAGDNGMATGEPTTIDGQKPQQRSPDGAGGDGATPTDDGATVSDGGGATGRTETAEAAPSTPERTAATGRETGTDGRATETTGTPSATETPSETTAESARTTTEAGTTTTAPNGTATETATTRGAGTTHAADANATPTATTATNATTTANATAADAANGTTADAAANATAIPTGPPTPIESSAFPGSLGHGHDPLARALDATAVHATTGQTVDVLPLPADAAVLAGALVLVSIVFRVLVLTWLCSRPCRGAVGYGAAVSHLAATCAEWLRISLLYRTYGRQVRLRGVLGCGSSSAARGRAIQKSH